MKRRGNNAVLNKTSNTETRELLKALPVVVTLPTERHWEITQGNFHMLSIVLKHLSWTLESHAHGHTHYLHIPNKWTLCLTYWMRKRVEPKSVLVFSLHNYD